MHALIFQVEERPWAGLLPVAGRPLLIRQIEWLIGAGFRQIVIESAGPPGECIEERLRAHGALGGRASVVRTSRPQGARMLAKKAGLGAEEPALAVPGDLLADADLLPLLAGAQGEISLELDAPLRGLRSGCVRLLGPRGPRARVQAQGWGAHLRSPSDALAFSAAVLEQRLPVHKWPILVPGAEVSPGVWVARGARVDPRARLTGPVFIGEDAVVCAGAQIGPEAVLCERTVVERNGIVIGATVAPGTVVGEGVRVESAFAVAGGIFDLDHERPVRLTDPLLLGSMLPLAGTIGPGARLVGLTVALLLAGPALLSHLYLRWRGRPSFRAAQPGCCGAGPAMLDGAGESALVDLMCRLVDLARGERPLAARDDEACPRCRSFAASLLGVGAEIEPPSRQTPAQGQQRLSRGEG